MTWERDSDREENADHQFMAKGSHEVPAPRRALKDRRRIIDLHRSLDGTVYAHKCLDCGSTWKIYQNVAHAKNCQEGE